LTIPTDSPEVSPEIYGTTDPLAPTAEAITGAITGAISLAIPVAMTATLNPSLKTPKIPKLPNIPNMSGSTDEKVKKYNNNFKS